MDPSFLYHYNPFVFSWIHCLFYLFYMLWSTTVLKPLLTQYTEFATIFPIFAVFSIVPVLPLLSFAYALSQKNNILGVYIHICVCVTRSVMSTLCDLDAYWESMHIRASHWLSGKDCNLCAFMSPSLCWIFQCFLAIISFFSFPPAYIYISEHVSCLSKPRYSSFKHLSNHRQNSNL